MAEKTAVAASKILPDFVVMTWPGGTGQVDHFDASPLASRRLWIWPDNDDAGRKAIETAMPRLHNLGFTVRVLRPPADQDWCDMLPEFEERQAIVSEADYV